MQHGVANGAERVKIAESAWHIQGGGLKRAGPITWPPRSPDLNPCDFFLWGHLKSLVYATPVDSPEVLIARIVVAAADIKSMPGISERVRESFLPRYRLCSDASGRHSQQLL
ncbi:hypothetical protein AVEN_273261-1 [Araneus ventricosus]|uniref:Tc1-like transposase DDE domain-containing protein n=1 Tax=Araneus ventricosus TaxID=182803 RepID=A0A4Y2TQH1_ARAVE|nr:hypothetical protein AVEN_273261-1 [Araneus ventricosus]